MWLTILYLVIISLEQFHGFHIARNQSLIVRKRVKRIIIRGRRVEENELPYVAQIIVNRRERSVPHCVGTIVGSSWIITATHCIVKDDSDEPYYHTEELAVRVGTSHASGRGGETYDVQDVFPNLNGADICLFQLKNEMTLDGVKLMAVKLPFRPPKYNVKGTVAGWGLTRTGRISRILRKLHVVNEEKEYCERMYDIEALDKRGVMCAHRKGNRGYGICQGDSGTGLIVNYYEPVIIGVASMTYKRCGVKPDYFTDVFEQIIWLRGLIS